MTPSKSPSTDIRARLARLAEPAAAASALRSRSIARFTERADASGLVDVAYATADSPVGPLLLASTQNGLVRVAYTAEGGEGGVLQQLAARISPRILERPARLDSARRELDEYFAGRRQAFDLAIDWRLTGPFAERVLRSTAAIPFGDCLTYGQIAAAAGSPRGARAAGNALGSNPIPIVIPCHRVLRGGGALGGYTGGVERKRALLAIEGVEPPR
ncbi:MAG: methylated-DNA--[protein]-cysteine S-methyltransferase [Solirubrobacteraceae bacterium]